MNDITIHKDMCFDDVSQVMEVERACFDIPWTEGDVIDTMDRDRFYWLIAVRKNEIVGYVVVLENKRSHVIKKVAVYPEYQGRSIGSMLVGAVVKYARERMRRGVIVDVPESKLTPQLFFNSCGFIATRIIEDTYESGWFVGNAYRFVFDFRKKCDPSLIDLGKVIHPPTAVAMCPECGGRLFVRIMGTVTIGAIQSNGHSLQSATGFDVQCMKDEDDPPNHYWHQDRWQKTIDALSRWLGLVKVKFNG